MIFTRWLKILCSAGHSKKATDSTLNILEWLVAEGFLKSNRQLDIELDLSRSPQFFRVICSMNTLEKMNLWGCGLQLAELPHVLRSCPKLVDLRFRQIKYSNLEMGEDLKNQLRSGFQRLRLFGLACYIDNNSWPVICEILT
jgi:hypothetical protein